MSHFAQYIKSLAIFSESKQQEIHWLFDSLINSLVIAERNARDQRHSAAATSLQHAKNLMRFLNRSFQDLPDAQLVGHLDQFFEMLERSIDHSMQLPLAEDLQEVRLLICDLQRGWDGMLQPTTSSPSWLGSAQEAVTREILA